MSDCNHDCASCASKKDGTCNGEKPAGFAAPANARSHVARVIAVMSGKGGVGKSLVTELLAVQAQKRGLKVAVLDADITGPSIPTAFGVKDRATSDGEGILPCRSESGIALMSLNFLVENPADPVVWRGPVIAGAVKQFWSDVAWGDVDVMFVDLPPGTGDVPLTVFQSLPVTGAVVVTSPQDLVSLIVEKAVRMAGMMDVPVLGLVENMSVFRCPDCGAEHRIFGPSRAGELASRHGIAAVASLPIDPEYAKAVDLGAVEKLDAPSLDVILDAVLATAASVC
ncbi:MAG: Mrp/NBP35 family ATP-binding protein [Kiritimatiellae bacterium]|nr:Mrp/NBP35 family ATP-binding protein [Kiritimatiellia bacterium]